MSETQALAIVPKEELAVAPKEMDYGSLMALAKELCTTGFLPAAVKTPAQAVAIIMTGRELGLGPMQSLRSICIIQGKPELAADLQLSIFHRDGGRSKWLALTEVKAVLWLRHPNGDEHTETFTMQDAHRAGLATGMNWQKYPKAMLRSRAITAGLKSIGFEPLAGAYAPGEIGGPEIVGPEPETVLEPSGQESLRPNATKSDSDRPSATQTPLRAQASSAAQKPAQAPPQNQPSAPEPRYATAKSREWLIKRLEPQRDLATEYFRKVANPAVLLPNENLEDLPLWVLPIDLKQTELLEDVIRDFGNGGEVRHAYRPNELKPTTPPAAAPAPIAKPAAPSNGNKRDPEWFFSVICPVPHKGQKRDDYLKHPDTIRSLYTQMKEGNEEAGKRLWGFANHYEAKGWTGNDGQTRPPSNADLVFREALDAFLAWEEKHGEDTRGHPEDDFPENRDDNEDQDVPF